VADGARLESGLGASPQGFESPILRQVASSGAGPSDRTKPGHLSGLIVNPDLRSTVFEFYRTHLSCILVSTVKLDHPMQSVIPSAHGAVLGVLARTSEAMSGRRVAALTRPPFSQSRVNTVLGELVRDGIAEVELRPPASYYRLNRDHVAAPGILALVSMWPTLLDRIRSSLSEWPTQPIAVWLFGSAARAEADAESDLDILLIRPDYLQDDDDWQSRLEALVVQVRSWSGNQCEPLVLTESELQAAVRRDDRLVSELRHDAIHLAGAGPRDLLGRRAS
jgi:hypothetical protein